MTCRPSRSGRPGLLESRVPFIAGLAQAGFERVVYLGGREFKGLAREAALKMLELSDGKVVALAETPLGFRHGPKTIVNGKTLVVMFLSNDPYARQYEADLLRELRIRWGSGAGCCPGGCGGWYFSGCSCDGRATWRCVSRTRCLLRRWHFCARFHWGFVLTLRMPGAS